MNPAVDEWLRTFICQPHEGLRRPGPVCPFVQPALRSGALHVRTRPGYATATRTDLLELVEDMVSDLRSRPRRTLEAIIYVLPDLPADRWPLLDGAQRSAKPGLAERGLMLGQFHPSCPVPSARNADFPVSRSPVPLLVIRQMAPHDIMFLREHPRCVAAYYRYFPTHNAAPRHG